MAINNMLYRVGVDESNVQKLPYDGTKLKAALLNQTNSSTNGINSWEGLAGFANNKLADAYKNNVTPDAQTLANGGLNQDSYNGLVKDAVIKTGGTYTDTKPPEEIKTPETVKDALISTTPTYTKAPDNSGMINDSYSSLVSALKAQIQQRMNDKQMQINALGEKYQPQKNQSEVMRNTDLRSILEQSANAGDRGGIGRQNALETQTSADNRLNAIDLQQKSDETSLKNDIANLLLEGNIQEAQFQSQKLKDLISNNQYVDETNYNRLTNADNTNYNRLRDVIQDTGKMANGEYTQAGQLNNQNIAMNNIEMKEKTDPNSITNQMARLGLDTAKLNFTALPDQLKNEATLTLQSIQKGDIDIKTGTAQLKELTDPNSITNQLAKIGLDTAKLNFSALPQQIKDEATILAQSVQKGAIDIKVANAQLKELTNPNSITNQLARLGLNTAKLNYQALPAQLKGEADKLAQDLEAGRISIDTARKQLDNLKNGLTKDGKATTTTVKPPMTAAQIGAAKMKIMESLIQKDEYGKVISYPTDEAVNARFESFYGFSPTQTIAPTQPSGLQW